MEEENYGITDIPAFNCDPLLDATDRQEPGLADLARPRKRRIGEESGRRSRKSDDLPTCERSVHLDSALSKKTGVTVTRTKKNSRLTIRTLGS